jgi:hypothetical protein
VIYSQPCALASNQGIAMTLDGRNKLHDGCTGLCVLDLKTETCECPCHEGASRLKRAALGAKSETPLPAGVTVSGGDPVAAAQDTTRTRAAANGRCEHCGAATGGRFAPGHDAKLKAQLWKEALEGSYKSYAEMYIRGWHNGKDLTRLSFETETRGVDLANERGWAFVEGRNRVRQDRGGTPISS